MPTINVPVYITDDDFSVWLLHKEELCTEARDAFKSALGELKK